MSSTLNRDEWLGVLERIAGELGREGPAVRLCLIGSAACLLGGMEGRSSRDLDVWRTASDYDRLDLRRAVEAAGCLFDPKMTLLPDRPYVQIVDPGPAELGAFQPVLVDRMGRLESTARRLKTSSLPNWRGVMRVILRTCSFLQAHIR